MIHSLHPLGQEGAGLPGAFIRGQFETSPENRLVHPYFFCLDPPRRRWTQKPPGQERYQRDPRAAMLKAFMGGGWGRGGAAVTRIRMAPAESEWPISQWQPKAGPARRPSLSEASVLPARKKPSLGASLPTFPSPSGSSRTQASVFLGSPKPNPSPQGYTSRSQIKIPPWPNSDLQVKFYPLPDKDHPKDFLGQETTETIALAGKWFWHEMKIVQASPPP